MPDVQEIIDGLRKNPIHNGPADISSPLVPLADAERAVHAAADTRTREILDALGERSSSAVNCDCFCCRVAFEARKTEPLAAGYVTGAILRAAAAEVARRFPNGGTNDSAGAEST